MATTPTIIAATDDEAQFEALAKAAAGLPGAPVVRRVSPSGAPAAAVAGADMVVLFVKGLDEESTRLIESVVRARPESAVVVALEKVERPTLVTLIRLGATDVLDLPISVDVARQTLGLLLGRKQVEETSRNSRIWSVFGAGGGCGVTTLAVNAAERLARISPGVAIADLNLEMGDVSVFLNVKPRYTLTDLALNSSKLDSSYLATTVPAHSSGVHVLPAPREIEDSDEVSPARLRVMLRSLRGSYEHLVIDTPSVFNETTVEALDQSDGILLVAMLNIPSVRNAKRIRAAFDRLGYPAGKIRLLINRFEKKADISVDEASALVGLPVFHTVPNDYPSVIRSINVGEPVAVVSPKSGVTRALETLAEKLKAEPGAAANSEAPAAAPAPKEAAKSGGFRFWKKET